MEQTSRARWGARRIALTLLGVVVLAGLAYGAFVLFAPAGPAEAPELNYSLVNPQRGAIEATINASGTMQPRDIVELDFATTGVVREILVDVGDEVTIGAALARLDDSEQTLQVEQVRASLAQAQADYERLLAGAAPAEVARAEAELTRARGQLQQTEGTVTQQDVTAAQATLEQARANLERLEAGADPFDVQGAQTSLEQSRANLQTQRDSLSAAKTQAEERLEQAANALRDRQSDYSRIYWDNRELERELGEVGNDAVVRSKDRQEEAWRAVQNAEAELEQARIAYEEAQNTEISGIQAAEADVRSAENQLADIQTGPRDDELAAARAQVADAQAGLARLVGSERAGSVSAARAGVDVAQANLEQLNADPRDFEIDSAQASIRRAEAELEQAELEISKTTLRTPLAGTVAEVNLQVGEAPDASAPAVVVADLSGFYVTITVDEIDVARLDVDQPARLTLDALPELELEGVVDRINPLATSGAAVTSYEVRLRTRGNVERVRSGMSTNADIIVERKTDALIVPRRAVYTDDGDLFVDLPADQALCEADQATWPVEPELRAVPVEVGLRNELAIEIVGGDLDEQSCIYIEGFDARMQPLTGPPPRQRGN